MNKIPFQLLSFSLQTSFKNWVFFRIPSLELFYLYIPFQQLVYLLLPSWFKS